MFHKRWQNKVLQAKCGSKRLSVFLENVHKTFTKPPIIFHSLFVQNVSRKVCQTSRCYFVRHFESRNVISTYFRLPAGVMLRTLRYLKTLRDAARCLFLRTACTLNPTSAKHLPCSFRLIVLGKELSPLYRFSWGHKEVKGYRHIQQATELLQQIVQ
jgi:hypothetical protein